MHLVWFFFYFLLGDECGHVRVIEATSLSFFFPYFIFSTVLFQSSITSKVSSVMAAQYMNILINDRYVYPIKVFINSNNILKSDFSEDNNIVINNDLFQLYKPSYKIIISNRDLENLYKYIKTDIDFIFKHLFSSENIKKLLKIQINSDKLNTFQKILDYSSLNYVHVDSLQSNEGLSFDKIYRFSKSGFVLNINSHSWNLLFVINDYNKIRDMFSVGIDDDIKTGKDLQILQSHTDIIPKILIEDDDTNFDTPVDTKPEFKTSYSNLRFISDSDDINIVIMDKNSKNIL